MPSYYDDEEYVSLRSETHQQRVRRLQLEIPTVEEMLKILIGLMRHGVVTQINTWIRKCKKREEMKEMLEKLLKTVSNTNDLKNREYNFGIITNENNEKIIYYGKDGKTPSEIRPPIRTQEHKPEPEIKVEETKTRLPSSTVIPGKKWSEIIKSYN